MPANSFVAGFLAVFHPLRYKQRTTFAALIVLVCLTTYIFIAHSTTLSSIALRQSETSTADQIALALETIQKSRIAEDNRTHKSNLQTEPQLQLNLAQELAAVSSFLASLPQNVIAPSVDPKVPIDPQLVLDFDTRGPRALEELQALAEDVWARNPVFVYSKHFSTSSRELKSILSDLYLQPAPTIIDVDIREDFDVLSPMITRLTGTDLPVLLIGGKVIGSTKEARALLETQELQKLISAAGAQIDGAKRKKHRK